MVLLRPLRGKILLKQPLLERILQSLHHWDPPLFQPILDQLKQINYPKKIQVCIFILFALLTQLFINLLYSFKQGKLFRLIIQKQHHTFSINMVLSPNFINVMDFYFYAEYMASLLQKRKTVSRLCNDQGHSCKHMHFQCTIWHVRQVVESQKQVE